MSTRLISSIYLRGDEAAAHYKSYGNADWSYVLKNARHKGKGHNVNVWQHAYEKINGTGLPVHSDPLMEMLK